MVSQDLQTIQFLEQNLQAVFMQKQNFQFELDETETAIEEIKKSKDDVYKTIGQIMINVPKEDLVKELEEKKIKIENKLKTLQKQEENFTNQLTEIRKKIIEKEKKKEQ